MSRPPSTRTAKASGLDGDVAARIVASSAEPLIVVACADGRLLEVSEPAVALLGSRRDIARLAVEWHSSLPSLIKRGKASFHAVLPKSSQRVSVSVEEAGEKASQRVYVCRLRMELGAELARAPTDTPPGLSEESFRIAADIINGVVYDWNIATGEVTRSVGLERMLGFRAAELTPDAHAYRDLVHPDDKPRVRDRLSEVLRGEAQAGIEYRLRDASGEYRIVSDTLTVLRDESGEAVRVVGFLLDVTRQRTADDEIRSLNAELERRVALRTAQLEATNSELEAFTYSVSHDLRAPVRHVTGFSQLLLSELGDTANETAKRYIDTILTATTRMGDLIDKLLMLSRIGQTALQYQQVDVGRLLEEVRHELAPDVGLRRVEWTTTSLPIVMGDRPLLRAALTNLVSNALKFTRPRDPATLDLHYECDAVNCMHVFRLTDNGVGFEMRYADKLFGVFQRLHSAGDFEGTGVGLASVRRIIQRHGGRVWAKGEPDVGAVFGFTLPIDPIVDPVRA